MMTGTQSPLPPTVEDRDAEIAALQTAFDEYIASSRELEDELDAELAKMQEKLAESSAANSALITQLESMNPQLSSLERALAETKARHESESNLRRQSELNQDEAEARAREAEGSIEALKTECDEVHEQLAFREEEVEETRLELEVEKERHNVEMEEMANQVAELTKKGIVNGGTGGGGAITTDPNAVNKKNKNVSGTESVSPSIMSGMTIETRNNVADDADDDYVKRLEDELEDVTEQLIEAETSISDMEGKLADAEKNKIDLETKVVQMETKVDDLKKNIVTAAESAHEKVASNAENAVDASAQQEELALLNEELNLTQEELKAAEQDKEEAEAKVTALQKTNKTELASLQDELKKAKGEARSAQLEVSSLEKALNDANTETAPMRIEVDNLNEALHNAKRDNEKTIKEMTQLRQAFDRQGDDQREAFEQREEELVREHVKEVKSLETEFNALKKKFASSGISPPTSPRESQTDLQIRLEQTEEDLSRATHDLNETKTELVHSKRRVAELVAGDQHSVSVVDPSAIFITSHIQKLTDRLEIDSSSQASNPRSEYFRSHARSRTRSAYHSSRARSSSPSTVERLERDLLERSDRVKKLTDEKDKLKQQSRMSDVRMKHLEDDVSRLHTQMNQEPDDDEMVNQDNGLQLAVTESRDQMEVMDTDVERILNSGDKENIASEFMALAKKANAQKEHNAQLLVKILKLQGNIQVCCRIRPLTNGEIKRGEKRVVENLSESEVGCFDSRIKGWKSYAFDKVWGANASQGSVFQDVEPLALSVIDGYNACIFAYGQTGSGKTYTMEGTRGVDVGISYRTIEKVFNLLNYRKAQQAAAVKKYEEASFNRAGPTVDASALPSGGDQTSEFMFSISVGMLEIYNDGVYDLLVNRDPHAITQQNKSLEIKRDKLGNIHVEGLTKEPVTTLLDVLKLLKRGNESRKTAATNLNEHSSRSHMVLSVEVTSGIEGEEPSIGTLFLVDLAGSERVRKSAVVGENLKEATHINKSLSALGNVMESLDRKASHVPYRDSKLTYLLQDSLGGNSRTMMVVTVCPTSITFDETQHALQFATRVRRIHIGSAKKNVTSKNLEETVKALTSELKMLAKAKERSEEQLSSLKRDHGRIQDRLKSSSESRAKAQDEARTLTVLKQSNAQMTTRWQKEKQLHDKAVGELETHQNDAKRIQQQLSKATRECTRLGNLVEERETAQHVLKDELRKAKDASSAANLRARKAQMLQSRPNNEVVEKKIKAAREGPVVKPARPPSVDSEEARGKVLEMLEAHDPKKMDKIDAIMERFSGRESFLLMKMAARYNNPSNNSENAPVTQAKSVQAKGSTGGNSVQKNSAAQKRSEMALARHMERMRNRKSERTLNSAA